MPIIITTSGPEQSALPDALNILKICQEVALVIGMDEPESVFGSDLREHRELANLANEMAQRIAHDTHDWIALRSIATFFGDGVELQQEMPADYKRMLKKAAVWPSNMPWSPLSHIADSDNFLGYEVQNFTPPFGIWTLMGRAMAIKPAVPSGESAQFVYISKSIVIGADETTEDTTRFTKDTDLFVLDDRVLKLGMIWQWKANKGQSYAEDMSTYETALAMCIGADKGSNVLIAASKRYMQGDPVFAFPGNIIP